MPSALASTAVWLVGPPRSRDDGEHPLRVETRRSQRVTDHARRARTAYRGRGFPAVARRAAAPPPGRGCRRARPGPVRRASGRRPACRGRRRSLPRRARRRPARAHQLRDDRGERRIAGDPGLPDERTTRTPRRAAASASSSPPTASSASAARSVSAPTSIGAPSRGGRTGPWTRATGPAATPLLTPIPEYVDGIGVTRAQRG